MRCLAILALACIVAGCSLQKTVERRFPGVDFTISPRPDLMMLLGDKQGPVVVEFCNLRLDDRAIADACRQKDPALEGVRGFYVILSEAGSGQSRLRPRPRDLALPTTALLPASPPSKGDKFDYEVRRLTFSERTPLMTTQAGWPLIGCLPNNVGQSCTLGFLIEGAVVEVSWNQRGGPPDQAEVGRIATGIDAKLRSFATIG